ncbi:hypothetical protein Ocin01_17349 [Orchesella cincta]|uniref:Uncharacterized protein n=1 Tax=Orchesella cincta TaxID=48709 RepID=A0A1D2M8W0_ORCCI|nr:hypothetical protein Ocin01_17349 [Orchesella cincta]
MEYLASESLSWPVTPLDNRRRVSSPVIYNSPSAVLFPKKTEKKSA